MTISPTVEARGIILPALKASAAVTALIPATKLYPTKTPSNPVKPFGRYGAESVEPVRAACWRGGDVQGAYHVWVGVTSTILDAKVYCERCVAAIADVIDDLPDCNVDRTQIFEDTEESDIWHGVVLYTASIVEQA